MSTYYASVHFIRKIRSKCAWLTFFWTLAALMNLGDMGQRILDRSWWSVALYATFTVITTGLAIGQAREWRKWDPPTPGINATASMASPNAMTASPPAANTGAPPG